VRGQRWRLPGGHTRLRQRGQEQQRDNQLGRAHRSYPQRTVELPFRDVVTHFDCYAEPITYGFTNNADTHRDANALRYHHCNRHAHLDAHTDTNVHDNRDADEQRDRFANGQCNADVHSDADAFGHPDANLQLNTDLHGQPHTEPVADTDRQRHPHIHIDSDAHAFGHRDTNLDRDTDLHSQPHTKLLADTDSDYQSYPDTHRPVVLRRQPERRRAGRRHQHLAELRRRGSRGRGRRQSMPSLQPDVVELCWQRWVQ
jgi:hypothetical protein